MGDHDRFSIITSCFVVDLFDRRTGDDVVKLVEEDDFPSPFKVISGVIGRILGIERCEKFGIAEEEFAFPVVGFGFSLTRQRAPVSF